MSKKEYRYSTMKSYNYLIPPSANFFLNAFLLSSIVSSIKGKPYHAVVIPNNAPVNVRNNGVLSLIGNQERPVFIRLGSWETPSIPIGIIPAIIHIYHGIDFNFFQLLKTKGRKLIYRSKWLHLFRRKPLCNRQSHSHQKLLRQVHHDYQDLLPVQTIIHYSTRQFRVDKLLVRQIKTTIDKLTGGKEDCRSYKSPWQEVLLHIFQKQVLKMANRQI